MFIFTRKSKLQQEISALQNSIMQLSSELDPAAVTLTIQSIGEMFEKWYDMEQSMFVSETGAAKWNVNNLHRKLLDLPTFSYLTEELSGTFQLLFGSLTSKDTPYGRFLLLCDVITLKFDSRITELLRQKYLLLTYERSKGWAGVNSFEAVSLIMQKYGTTWVWLIPIYQYYLTKKTVAERPKSIAGYNA